MSRHYNNLLSGWIEGKLLRTGAVGFLPAEYIALKEKIMIALYSYTAEDDDEVSFNEGDKVLKLSEPDSEGRNTNDYV